MSGAERLHPHLSSKPCIYGSYGVSYSQKVPKGQDRCPPVLLVGECRGGNVWGLGIGAFKTVSVEKWKRLARL